MLRTSFKVIPLIGALLGLLSGPVFAGAVFVSGHDAIWHSQQGGNSVGATHIALTGINYARDSSTAKFLFIESKTTAIPSGNLRTASFLTSALGFAATDFDVMDGADLSLLPSFATSLTTYSAIVVASDHGGMLTGAELGFLNAHASDIIDFINAGGGVAAFAESNVKGLLGANAPFGFIPFLVSSTAFGEAESGNTVTAFGGGLGLVDSDTNGNFSHNFFTATGGMNAVDLRNGNPDEILTLAVNSQISSTGVVSAPEPSTLAIFGLGLAGLGFMRRRKLN